MGNAKISFLLPIGIGWGSYYKRIKDLRAKVPTLEDFKGNRAELITVFKKTENKSMYHQFLEYEEKREKTLQDIKQQFTDKYFMLELVDRIKSETWKSSENISTLQLKVMYKFTTLNGERPLFKSSLFELYGPIGILYPFTKLEQKEKIIESFFEEKFPKRIIKMNPLERAFLE